MKKLYEKNELTFAILCIAGYVVLFSAADSLSRSFGTEKIVTAPAGIIAALSLFAWIKSNGLREKYGLCAFAGNLKNYLYFAPLLLIMSTNLWNGLTLKYTLRESALYVLSMLCVGFLEEVIFRGLLFKAIYKDSRRQAVIISSVTFGIGHIVNLLSGADIFSTLLQICYAVAIGFLFTVIFLKGKSLLPCIVTHCVVNSLSAFAVSGSPMYEIVTSAVLCAASLSYGLWILKHGD